MSHEPAGGPDDALLDRLLAGDEAAFSPLVTTYHRSLIRLALTLVADRGAAEEVVQEIWLGTETCSRCFALNGANHAADAWRIVALLEILERPFSARGPRPRSHA